MDSNQEYNQDEELEIAEIMRNKAEILADEQGLSYDEIKEKGQIAFDQARRQYALEFLKKLEKKLSELNNQEVAQILLALINSGFPIENEEELEYWINRLERESLQRVAMYFMVRNEGSLKIAPKHKKRFLKNVKDFTADDIEAFASMMTSVNQIMEKKIPKDKNGDEYKKYLAKAKFFKEVERILKKDTQEKQKEVKEKSQARKPKPENKDYLSKLKNKMSNQGVEEGGTYWNSVIGSYNVATDKAKFVEKWQKDESVTQTKAQIRELRGIDNLENRVKTPEKSRTNQNQPKQNIAVNSRNSGR